MSMRNSEKRERLTLVELNRPSKAQIKVGYLGYIKRTASLSSFLLFTLNRIAEQSNVVQNRH